MLNDCHSRQTRKARKFHRCCECGSTIVKGEEYQIDSGITDGLPFSFKSCASCADLRRKLWNEAAYAGKFEDLVIGDMISYINEDGNGVEAWQAGVGEFLDRRVAVGRAKRKEKEASCAGT